MRRSGLRGARIALAVLALWYVAVLVWAYRPLSETMRVGIDYRAEPPSALSVTVECDSIFSSTSRSAELPVLPSQPDGQPPLAFPREPCEFVRSDARRAFAVDTIVVVLAGATLLWFGVRHRRRDEPGDAPAVGSPDASVVD